MKDNLVRHTAEFDALTCAIDETVDAFLRTSSVLDDIDVVQALRVTKESRQDRINETDGTNWSEFYNKFEMDGRGTE